jgi:uncharacterized membrane protein (DUF4010 family)
METPLVVFERLLVAVLIGVLIGLDRERAEVRKARRLFAGVRTFPLIALAGALPMLVFETTGPLLLALSFLIVSFLILASYFRTSASGDVGVTTEMAALTTFLLGVLAGAGQLLIAGATGVGIAVLLVAKPRLEGFSRALTNDEIEAVLELAVISIIILPLLPNEGYGPWQVFNPFHIWLMVVLVSGFSFVGFVAMRLWGERQGLTIAGIIGALVSSTAVTMSMAARSRSGAELEPAAAAATVMASTIMCVRVAILAGAVNVGILPRLLPVLSAMTITGAFSAWLLLRKVTTVAADSSGAQLTNPFSLAEALSFAVIYAVVLLLARAGQEYFGSAGMYVAAALSAIADVDAVTIAFTRLGATHGGWQAPAAAVTIALVTNTLVKMGIAVAAGSVHFRHYVAAALGVMATLGAVAGAFTFIY